MFSLVIQLKIHAAEQLLKDLEKGSHLGSVQSDKTKLKINFSSYYIQKNL
jgi:hypothetical protein